jgi:tRNA1Val (adenine37-N6)-methyltransferase
VTVPVQDSPPGPCPSRERHGETLDELRPAGLKILQPAEGYRFSLDPVLLAGFARVGKGEAVADLGTGSGVIPLLLAARTQAARIVGVERQPAAADRARRSVLLNQLQARVEIVEADLREIKGVLAPQSFDAVLANPPYRSPGSGRRAPDAERAAARHELAGGLGDFLAAAAFLLGDGGRLSLVFLAERLAELLSGMRAAGLEPKRLRCVHSRPGEPARLVLVEGRRRGRRGMTVEAPLFVYDGETYSAEVAAFYAPSPLDKTPPSH